MAFTLKEELENRFLSVIGVSRSSALPIPILVFSVLHERPSRQREFTPRPLRSQLHREDELHLSVPSLDTRGTGQRRRPARPVIILDGSSPSFL